MPDLIAQSTWILRVVPVATATQKPESYFGEAELLVGRGRMPAHLMSGRTASVQMLAPQGQEGTQRRLGKGLGVEQTTMGVAVRKGIEDLVPDQSLDGLLGEQGRKQLIHRSASGLAARVPAEMPMAERRCDRSPGRRLPSCWES